MLLSAYNKTGILARDASFVRETPRNYALTFYGRKLEVWDEKKIGRLVTLNILNYFQTFRPVIT